MATEEEQAVYELIELVGAPEAPDGGDAETGRRGPDVAPAWGEHARPHRLVRRQEREDDGKDVVQEVFHLRRGRRFAVLELLPRGAFRRPGGVRPRYRARTAKAKG